MVYSLQNCHIFFFPLFLKKTLWYKNKQSNNRWGKSVADFLWRPWSSCLQEPLTEQTCCTLLNFSRWCERVLTRQELLCVSVVQIISEWRLWHLHPAPVAGLSSEINMFCFFVRTPHALARAVGHVKKHRCWKSAAFNLGATSAFFSSL